MRKEYVIKNLLFALIFILLILSLNMTNKKIDGKFKFNNKNNEYRYNGIKILNDLELSFDVENNTYSISGIIENDSNKAYKDLKIYLELYDVDNKKIDDYIIKIDSIGKKETKEIDYDFGDLGIMVYEHKITKIKAEVK